MEVWNMFVFFNLVMFRFHVDFQVCTDFLFCTIKDAGANKAD